MGHEHEGHVAPPPPPPVAAAQLPRCGGSLNRKQVWRHRCPGLTCWSTLEPPAPLHQCYNIVTIATIAANCCEYVFELIVQCWGDAWLGTLLLLSAKLGQEPSQSYLKLIGGGKIFKYLKDKKMIHNVCDFPYLSGSINNGRDEDERKLLLRFAINCNQHTFIPTGSYQPVVLIQLHFCDLSSSLEHYHAS